MAAPPPVHDADSVAAEGFGTVPASETLQGGPSVPPDVVRATPVGESLGGVPGGDQVPAVIPTVIAPPGDQGVKSVTGEPFGGVGGADSIIVQTQTVPHSVDGSEAFNSASDSALRRAEKACRCGKTRCLKQYCSCFRIDARCTPECKCSECYNDGSHEDERLKAVRLIRLNDPMAFKGTSLELEGFKTSRGTVKTVRGCRCRRSKCQQKYCECYGNGFKCTDNCICEECENGKGSGAPGQGGPLSPGGKAAGDTVASQLEAAAAAATGGAAGGDDATKGGRLVSVEGQGPAAIKTLRGCRCRRSKCQQKYCECYGNGLKCTDNCNCEDCENGKGGTKGAPPPPANGPPILGKDGQRPCGVDDGEKSKKRRLDGSNKAKALDDGSKEVPAAQLAALRESLHALGDKYPVVIDEGREAFDLAGRLIDEALVKSAEGSQALKIVRARDELKRIAAKKGGPEMLKALGFDEGDTSIVLDRTWLEKAREMLRAAGEVRGGIQTLNV
jgi:hypothetical protein